MSPAIEPTAGASVARGAPFPNCAKRQLLCVGGGFPMVTFSVMASLLLVVVDAHAIDARLHVDNRSALFKTNF